ncbi:hypothetical protein [Globicatella sanguinis]
MSGIKLCLKDLFEAHSNAAGKQAEAQLIWFSTSGLLPTVRGGTDEAKIIKFSTSCPLPLPNNQIKNRRIYLLL